MCKSIFGRNIYVRSKFSCVHSSHNLCVCAHVHSLEGTLNQIANLHVESYGPRTLKTGECLRCIPGWPICCIFSSIWYALFRKEATSRIGRSAFLRFVGTTFGMNWIRLAIIWSTSSYTVSSVFSSSGESFIMFTRLAFHLPNFIRKHFNFMVIIL